MEKAISTNSSLRGVRHNQSAKKVQKSKKQLIGPSSENPNIENFVEEVASWEEGATHDSIVKKPTT